jgi:ABC-type polysaccharide/polyol phosphate export permease
MIAVTHGQMVAAGMDLQAGARDWRLSRLLAWQDIKQRYRRSTLGPIWLTLSSGIQMLTMSMLSSFLFNAPVQKAIPFVCAGMLFWQLITGMINDGAALFVSSSSYITQIKCPFSVFVMQVIWRNLFIATHNAVIYIVVALIFAVIPSASMLLWPLGLALDMICVSWIVLFCATVSARYRDVPIMIQNLLTVLLWLTPLMYFPEQLGSKRFLADYNPFTHMIALLREPLLGGTPTLNDWLVVLAIAVLGWIGTLLFFARFRARIVYWL